MILKVLGREWIKILKNSIFLFLVVTPILQSKVERKKSYKNIYVCTLESPIVTAACGSPIAS